MILPQKVDQKEKIFIYGLIILIFLGLVVYFIYQYNITSLSTEAPLLDQQLSAKMQAGTNKTANTTRGTSTAEINNQNKTTATSTSSGINKDTTSTADKKNLIDTRVFSDVKFRSLKEAGMVKYEPDGGNDNPFVGSK